MTLWDHACCVGYGIQARVDAIGHILRGHKLLWRGYGCIDPWTGHTGCIICEECPDSSVEDGKHVGYVFWMRHWRWMNWVGQKVCAFLGHSERRHPQTGDGNGGWVDVPDEWYCYRCLADL